MLGSSPSAKSAAFPSRPLRIRRRERERGAAAPPDSQQAPPACARGACSWRFGGGQLPPER
eukprot:9222245-Alexandrium_andersonii.AAC.1